MANYIAEWYGFRPEDDSVAANIAAEERYCSFLEDECTKRGGACSVAYGPEIVTICPKRLYGEGHAFLQGIAEKSFGGFGPRTVNGRVLLVEGSQSVPMAQRTGVPQVGVFGQNWDSEIKLPPTVGGARYSVDFTLVCVAPSGELMGFIPIEVQTIDTTSSYAASLRSLERDRSVSASGFGLNWENVNKRILPQLITKGLMLQGEALCQNGIYFVTPAPVFDRIMARLGGQSRFREIPRQPGSITFIRYSHNLSDARPGSPVPLDASAELTISTSDMSLAFISPDNLPPAGSYGELIRAKLQPSSNS